MADSQQGSWWQGKLLSIIHLFTEGGLILFLRNLLDAWDLVSQLRDRIGYHGMYEILDYHSTLDISDERGEHALLARREVIRFLQDNVVAIHDHAWGDGDIFAEYHCQPGIPVDFYQDGSKHNVLISLRETKNRGDIVELSIERDSRRVSKEKRMVGDGSRSSHKPSSAFDHLPQGAALPESHVKPKERQQDGSLG